ncbi:MAG TPA: LLM class flavin-dependent oxidoreductase [Acidimicrobiia bacterium]
MKVRVGFGLGANAAAGDAAGFAALVDALDHHRFDSLWLSERIGAPSPDPVIGLAIAAGRSARLKLGTSVQVLPGRNPVLLAKQWATLDVLSGGRVLPAFGLGIVAPNEQAAFGITREERAPWFDEVLPLLRRFWTEESVDHDGPRFHYHGLSVLPKPVQQPPDVWLGGKAPSELRRVGRLGDGWLASFATPADCEAGRPVIEAAAEAAGRAIDDEHYGAMVFYTRDEIPDALAKTIAARNPGVDPRDLVHSGIPAVRKACERFVDVGFSKLVLVPFTHPPSWDDELAEVAAEVLPIQT